MAVKVETYQAREIIRHSEAEDAVDQREEGANVLHLVRPRWRLKEISLAEHKAPDQVATEMLGHMTDIDTGSSCALVVDEADVNVVGLLGPPAL